MIGSVGELKTRCSAMVSSTAPRFGPRCPPVFATALTRKSRISSASCGSWATSSRLRSSGPSTDSRRLTWTFTSPYRRLGGSRQAIRSVYKAVTAVTQSHRTKVPPNRGRTAQRSHRTEVGGSGGLEEQAQHELHDAPVAVVVRLPWRIDPDHGLELHVAGLHGDFPRQRVSTGESDDGEGLLAGESECVTSLAVDELQRQDAHADQIAAV